MTFLNKVDKKIKSWLFRLRRISLIFHSGLCYKLCSKIEEMVLLS